MTELARPDRAAEGQLLVETSHQDGTVTLMVYGVIDIQSAAVFSRELDEAQSSGEQLILDLDGLSFMDSSALQLLVRAAQSAGDAGRRVILQRVPRNARRLLDITGMTSLFTIVD